MGERRTLVAAVDDRKGQSIPLGPHDAQIGPAGIHAGEGPLADEGEAADNCFSSVSLDLFGQPRSEPRGRGRPRHVPTPELREKVRKLRARGKNLLEVAAAIGITHPTLLLNYPNECASTSQAWRRRELRDRELKIPSEGEEK